MFKRNNFGSSLGGPVRRDRTFFHLVYEGIRERLGRTIVSSVIPASAKLDGGLVPRIDNRVKPFLALFPDANLPNNQFTFPASQPTDENFGQVRVDDRLGASDSMFVRYTAHDSQQTIPLDYPQFKSSNSSRGQFGTISEDHLFSSSLLNTFRFSYSRTNILILSHSGLIGPAYSFIPGRKMGVLNIGGVTPVAGFGPGTQPPAQETQNSFTWSDDLAYTKG